MRLILDGAGYIGSHTVLQLLQQGFRAVVIDNLDNASHLAVVRIAETVRHNGGNLVFHKVYIYSLFDSIPPPQHRGEEGRGLRSLDLRREKRD
jgi:UDP-glucose 4-epimerase